MPKVDEHGVWQHDVELTWDELATITIILEAYCAERPNSVHGTPLKVLDKFAEVTEDPMLVELVNDARELVENLNHEAHKRFIAGSGAS